MEKTPHVQQMKLKVLKMRQNASELFLLQNPKSVYTKLRARPGSSHLASRHPQGIVAPNPAVVQR